MGGLDFTVADSDQIGSTTPKDRQSRGRRNRRPIARAANGTSKVKPVRPVRGTELGSCETAEVAVSLAAPNVAGPGDICSESKRKQRIEVSATRRTKGEKQCK